MGGRIIKLSRDGRPVAGMELPDRWCPACDDIRTPAICGRFMESDDASNADRCGTPTIASADLDDITRARFDRRLAGLLPGGLSIA